MREINFKMPAPSMYIVPPEGTPGHRGMLSTFPEEVKFMQETVTPALIESMPSSSQMSIILIAARIDFSSAVGRRT